MSRRMRFYDGDEYGETERERLQRFAYDHPFRAVTPNLWRSVVSGMDAYDIMDRGGYYIVTHTPFIGERTTIARINNVGHKDDGWVRAVRAVMAHATKGAVAA